jgi:periplasmic divalent cation tolerance protein
MFMQNDTVFVTTTAGSEKEATSLETVILEDRLAACVQRLTIASAYWWKGKIEHEPEILLLIKTRADLAEDLMDKIRREHSYETPEIVVFPVTGGLPGYLSWISNSCREPKKERPDE